MKLGRYRLDSKIAEGGMASVWKGFGEDLHRTVAVGREREELALRLDVPGVFPGAQWPEPGEEGMLKPLKLEDLTNFFREWHGAPLSAKRRFPFSEISQERWRGSLTGAGRSASAVRRRGHTY